jgi:hypothetical protein
VADFLGVLLFRSGELRLGGGLLSSGVEVSFPLLGKLIGLM